MNTIIHLRLCRWLDGLMKCNLNSIISVYEVFVKQGLQGRPSCLTHKHTYVHTQERSRDILLANLVVFIFVFVSVLMIIYSSRLVNPAEGEVTWILDSGAAAELQLS